MPVEGIFYAILHIMKNTHLEHPEDTILNGDLSVLNWFTADSNISAKIDGAPAIVWGTHPNGKFFVGTKSVFNKIKIKINTKSNIQSTIHNPKYTFQNQTFKIRGSRFTF